MIKLDTFLVSNPRTALRVISRSAIESLNGRISLPRLAGEQRKDMPLVFTVVADESQQTEGEKLAQELRKNGISAQGVDVISSARNAQLVAPETLEIRFSRVANGEPVLTGLADQAKKLTAKEPKLVDVSADHDPGIYEIWFSKP